MIAVGVQTWGTDLAALRRYWRAERFAAEVLPAVGGGTEERDGLEIR